MKKFKNTALFLIFIMFMSADPSFAEVNLGGYYRTDLIYLQNNTIGSPVNNMNKLRFKFDYRPDESTLFHLEPQYVVMSGFKDFPIEGATGLDKVTWDRAYLSINLPSYDLTGGKQRIAWGTCYVWNPTDIFNPFSLTLTEDEKQGIDALRLIYHMGTASFFDAVYVPNRPDGDEKWAIKYKTNYFNYDLSLSYINMGQGPATPLSRQGQMAGFDFSGEGLDLGLRGEFAAFIPPSGNSYVDYSVGVDYTFDNGVGVDLEYFNNGRGRSDKADYDFNAMLSGEVSFLARHYASFSVSKMITEIEQVRGAVICNLVDGGLLLYPSYSYNLMEDLDLYIEAIFYSAEQGDEWSPDPAIDPLGIIGSNMYFVRLKYSF